MPREFRCQMVRHLWNLDHGCLASRGSFRYRPRQLEVPISLTRSGRDPEVKHRLIRVVYSVHERVGLPTKSALLSSLMDSEVTSSPATHSSWKNWRITMDRSGPAQRPTRHRDETLNERSEEHEPEGSIRSPVTQS